MNFKILVIISSLLLTSAAHAEIISKEIDYKQGDTIMKGMLAYDDDIKGKRPGVLIVHEWWGHNKHARDKARMLAKEGYVAFAVDMYGNRKNAEHPDDAGKFSSAVAGNMPLAKARFIAAMDTLKQQPNVESDQLAAMGYCFGGGVVLNMARMGVELKGVTSFHGSIATKNPAKKGDIKTRIMVFNGADDPFVKAEQITALKEEMANAGVDFEFINYPGAKHSFTNPDADATGKKFNLPLQYNAAADKDSWQKNLEFYKEIFSQ
ncbi:MAG: dienelactone hydrolase family protein [Gammaproteobacteria bacterium]|nr:dienelactone hydrolase family protein [Gammaproteobacteria bacterium]MBT8134798.1 dienelactone hydrolase family protein [Gammaproteobacteria bacterium]NNJ50771.1 dienelactone hydrolase family protein [Gammaproteobacteria bacterium]